MRKPEILVAVVLIGSLIGAVFLRAAVALCNKMAGRGADLVPEPAFGKALGINFIVMMVMSIADVIGRLATTEAPAHRPAIGVEQMIALPLSLLTMAGLLTALLPTSFGKAVLVTLLEVLISVVVVGGMIAIFVALWPQ